MKKQPIIAGNWKMNKNPSEGKLFIDDVQKNISEINNLSIIFFPPSTGLYNVQLKSPCYLGAQNCHWEKSGAYTGEISIDMLKDCDVSYTIVGHSERRQIFKESDQWVNKKIRTLLANNIKPILCIGETLQERDAMQTENVLEKQLYKGFAGLKSLENCIIAYEPIWAIGTGKTANKDQIKMAHGYIKTVLKKIYPDSFNCHILYGGSVNSKNAKELIQIKGVDGFLIGGASLDIKSFVSIIKIVSNI
ncbi:MAG: triose-phosphate isomerase [Candidatus Marinimicrobia bacterium]|nr:triose-phosphate isomerase [Candidatus Neomarinimicrobiota bacterium]|tara:strand:- start:415 stop:1158 length:744 start_codon:yes stop_codon:yes gene_type:complete